MGLPWLGHAMTRLVIACQWCADPWGYAGLHLLLFALVIAVTTALSYWQGKD